MTAKIETTILVGLEPYAFDDTWAKVPGHIKLGITHGLAIDVQGLVHVLHTVHETSKCRDAVAVFTPDGEFVRSWGRRFEGSGHGLHLTVEDGIEYAYVTDLKRGLFKTDLQGEVVWHVAKPAFYADRPHLAYQPTNVAVAPNGDVFLADGYGSYLIVRLDRSGNELDVFGGPGKTGHHLTHPHGLIYTERLGQPDLLVAENIATRLNYITLAGEHIGLINIETRRPRHFHERSDGTLLVPDFYSRITLINSDDQLIGHGCDAWDPSEHRPRSEVESRPALAGEFARPHDAVCDGQGNIYVAEYVATGRVTKLTKLTS